MNDISTLWMIALIAVLVGVVIGLIMARMKERSSGRDALQTELDEVRSELQTYKQNVGVHFAQTAELVNRLTDSYRDVHQHLSQSAQKLCDDKVLVASLMAQEQRPVLAAQTANQTEELENESVEAPKDYAPRKNPQEAGTLSEQYGIKSKAAEEAPFDPTKVTELGSDEGEDLNKTAQKSNN
ncbi:MAG TPA: DUF1043 family protein [Motiliproteus sp.]